MVVRAIGHGKKVGVVQFVKGAMATGEKQVFDAFPEQIEFKPMGEGFTWDTQDRARDIAVARAAWDEVKRMIADPSYAMVLADELNIVLRYDYLPLDEVLAVLGAKPEMTHVIVTGRNAPDALIEIADLVTEMTLIKHPFREQGVKAQAGIEF
jgi:cob(I)alamin adenosyltransferase